MPMAMVFQRMMLRLLSGTGKQLIKGMQGSVNLGVMYYNGDGVPENDVRAYVWLSMAKTQGYESAKKGVETVKNLMTKQQIAQAQALATQCYESDYKDCD